MDSISACHGVPGVSGTISIVSWSELRTGRGLDTRQEAPGRPGEGRNACHVQGQCHHDQISMERTFLGWKRARLPRVFALIAIILPR